MKRSYAVLDLVRFAAALLVMFFHLSYQGWLDSAHDPSALFFRAELRSIGATASSGWIGVPIFFVLSGFVIARSAENKSAADFIRGRVSRLYPAAWICATVTALVVSSDPETLPRYLRSLTLLPIGPWIDPVYWTLAIEISFYSLVACTLATCGAERLTLVGITLGLTSSSYWLLRLTDYATGRHFQPFFALFEGDVGGLLLITHGCFFSLGIVLRAIASEGPSKLKFITVLLCVLAGLVSITASIRFHIHEQQGAAEHFIVAPAIWCIAVVAIAVTAVTKTADWPHKKRFRQRLRQLGLATYPIYLLHNVAGLAAMRLLQPIGAFPALLTTVVTVILAGLLVVHLEKYPRRFLTICLSRERSDGEEPPWPAKT